MHYMQKHMRACVVSNVAPGVFNMEVLALHEISGHTAAAAVAVFVALAAVT
jgi:hypothetical protein